MEMWQSGRLRQTVNLFLTARWFESIRLHHFLARSYKGHYFGLSIRLSGFDSPSSRQTTSRWISGRSLALQADETGSIPVRDTILFLSSTAVVALDC